MITTSLHIDGTRIDVHRRGEGRLALLVHGFPLDHRMWIDQVRDLTSGSRMVAAPDLRGHGSSPWAGDEAHTMERLADDLAAVVAELSSDGAADVVGFSMGGYAALALHARHPEAIRSLALVDTRATPDSDEARQGRDRLAESVAERGHAVLVEEMLPKLVAEGASVLVRARVRTMLESQPLESVVADLRGLRDRPDRREELGSIRVPVSVVVGAEDVITPPADSEAMAEAVPGAELVVVPGAGHMSPVERPEAVGQALAGLWGRAG